MLSTCILFKNQFVKKMNTWVSISSISRMQFFKHKTSSLKIWQKQNIFPTDVPYLFEGCHDIQTMYFWMSGQISFLIPRNITISIPCK